MTTYPNPTSGVVNIQYYLAGQTMVEINVVNTKGQTVLFEEQQTKGTFLKRLDLSDQPVGVYFMILKAGGNVVASEKLIVL